MFFNIYFLLWKFPPNFPFSHSPNVVNGVFGELENLYYNIIIFIWCYFSCVCVYVYDDGGVFPLFSLLFLLFSSPIFHIPVLERSLCALLFCVCICVFLFLHCIFYYLFYDCLKWPILSRLTTQIAHFLLLLLSIISV